MIFFIVIVVYIAKVQKSICLTAIRLENQGIKKNQRPVRDSTAETNYMNMMKKWTIMSLTVVLPEF